MKKLIVSLMILMSLSVANAQITELKEARVGFDPVVPEVIVEGNSYTFKINRNYGAGFEEDPIAFLEDHCQMEAFIEMIGENIADGYNVEVKSTKGRLRAEYCKAGNLKKVSYKLKDVLLPAHLQREVYGNFKGWNMTRNVHIAKGRNGYLTNNYFKIRLEKDGQVQNLKINGSKVSSIELAGL